jgi:hypothetical protein
MHPSISVVCDNAHCWHEVRIPDRISASDHPSIIIFIIAKLNQFGDRNQKSSEATPFLFD